MALPSTGSISMDQVRRELGRTSGAISLGEAAVRALAGKPSGAISMGDLRGKSSIVVLTQKIVHKRLGFTEHNQSENTKVFTQPSGYGLTELNIMTTKHGSQYSAAFLLLNYTSGAKADELKANIESGKWKIVVKYGTTATRTYTKSDFSILHPAGGGAIQFQFNARQAFYLFIGGAASSNQPLRIEIG